MRKEIRSWAVIGSIFLFLYAMGWHTEVAAFAQRMILSTGVITPDIDSDLNEAADLDFSLISMQGDTLDMKTLKGKVIFMNVWATWCAPCVAEMPGIQNLYDEVASEDIVFIMLSVDKDYSKVQRFIDKKGYTFPIYHANESVPNIFRSGSIPTTYIISPEGNIVTKKIGMANYHRKKFVKYLQELAGR